MVDYRNLKLTDKNIDIFYPLTQKVSIISYVAKKYFTRSLLDIGCGKMPYKSMIQDESKIDKYVGVDIKNKIYQKDIAPDYFWEGKELPFPDNEYECAMLIEVLEHVPEPIEVLKETNRILKNKGKLLITVPFLWTLHDVPNDEYRYTPFSLKRMLEEAGFEVLEMEAFGGWHSSLASILALYARRALQGRKRLIATKILKPIIKYLYKKDEKGNKKNFKEGQMITGIWCVARAI